MAAAAAGLSPGWRRAALSIGHSADSLRPVGSTAAAAVLGTLETPLPAAAMGLIDAHNRPLVRLLHDAMSLGDGDAEALLSGANLAAIDGEVLQFERAAALGGGLFRIERLRRGLFGTDGMGAHDAGAPFVLLESDRLRLLEGIEVAAGRDLHAAAIGVGDDAAASASIAVTGRAALPYAPVHLRARFGEDGALRIDWIRRSRLGADWSLLVEPPLGEESERYRLLCLASDGTQLLQRETEGPGCELSPELIDAWRASGVASLRLALRQIGRNGLSPPAGITVSLT